MKLDTLVADKRFIRHLIPKGVLLLKTQQEKYNFVEKLNQSTNHFCL